MNETPLKPCPFCGSPVLMFYEGSCDWHLECTDPKNVCGADTILNVRRTRASKFDCEREEAVRRWNCRASAPVVRGASFDEALDVAETSIRR
jgi:hypothetical protein